MPWGLSLDDITDVGRSLNPFDDDKPKRPKKPKTAAERRRERREEQRKKDDDNVLERIWHWDPGGKHKNTSAFEDAMDAARTLITPGAQFAQVTKRGAGHVPFLGSMLQSNIGHVAELGAGLLPAAKTIGKFGYRDLRELGSPEGHDRPSLEDMSKYFDLLKYGWDSPAPGEKDKRKGKRPEAGSEIFGLVSEMAGSFGKSLERAVPNFSSGEDMHEFRKAWTDDLLLTALDVVPMIAAASRPLSAAKLASSISKANDISRGSAIAKGIRESYHPGSARRGKLVEGPPDAEGRPTFTREGQLEGGIEPRTHTADLGEGEVTIGGRPWSRIPIMRQMQRTYDSAFEKIPGAQEKRVGRAQQRLDQENKRRAILDQKELERPIGELLFGRVGRNLGAFGLKEGMSPKERRIATGLAYTTQMPRHMEPAAALEAVEADLSSIYRAGKIEIPKGKGRKRVKSARLTNEEKQDLAIQIGDINLVRKEIESGDITNDEWMKAQEAMAEIGRRTHEMGIDIMVRRYNLDAHEENALRDSWKARAEIIPRRLAARGILNSGNLADNVARQERIVELTGLFGEEQAQMAIALTDARARAARPQDPGSFWTDRVGRPTGEGADEYVKRVGDEALFPQMSQQADAIGDILFRGAERNLLDTGEFYSPLQKWIDEVMPDKMNAAQLQGTLKRGIPDEEYENIGLETFFHDKDPQEIIYKTEFQAHMASPLNAYNLREILLSNMNNAPEDMRSLFDIGHQGNYISRDPAEGEYFELLLQLPGERQYGGKGVGHWGRDNIVAHVRFHIFWEDGKLKMLVEEIQSDWANAWRGEKGKAQKLSQLHPDDEADLQNTRRLISEARFTQNNIRNRQHELNAQIQDLDTDVTQLQDLLAEYDNLSNKLDRLNEDIRVNEQYLSEYDLEGVAPSPLGTGTGAKSSYLNAPIRWLLRRADEANVDEIHVIGRETQLVRNHGANGFEGPVDRKTWMDGLKDADAQEVTEFIRNADYQGREFIGYQHDVPNAFAREMGVEGERTTMGYNGTYRHPSDASSDAWGMMPSTVFKMTDEAKALARKPASMYQRQPDWKGLPLGAAELMDDGARAVIHMFEGGNLSTWIHELGHVGYHDLSDADKLVIDSHLGGGFKYEDWTKMEHERFARAFEDYVRRGKSPNSELAAVFGKLREWMKVIWKQAQNSRRAEQIAPEVKEVMDRMFAAPPTDDMATWGYFPHHDIHHEAMLDYKGGVRPPAAGQVMGGPPRLGADTINRNANELLRYQTGAMNPDPGGLVSVFLKRLRFNVTLDARDEIYPIANPMSTPIPKGKRVWLVRDPHHVPEKIDDQAKAAARGRQLERPIDESLEEKLTLDPEDFRKEIIAKVGESPAWANDLEHVRWIDADYMEKRFGDVFDTPPRGKISSGMGLLTSAQRITGIYGRPISYILGNVPFNVSALMSQMPVSTIRNAAMAFDIKRNHPALWRAINSESGETRASGGLPDRYVRPQNKIQEAEQRVTGVQRGMAEKLSGFADDPYRSVAFINNARKKGYRTPNQLRHLIEENGTDLKEVRQMVREQMLDFDALNPTQRKIASQALYLWPFMYASMKWPFMFAREYPARAAIGATAIQREKEKGLPQEITNLWKRFGIDLTTINPLGPLGQVAEDTSTFFDDPTKLDLTALKERLSPTLDLLVEGMGGGREHALQNFIRGTVPGAAELMSEDPEYRGAKIYSDRSREGYLGQRHLRYWPRGVNWDRLQEMVDDALHDKVKGTAIEKEQDADWEKLGKYVKAVGDYDAEEIDEIRTSFKAWWVYQEAVDVKKDSLGQRKLTPYQQIEVLTPIVEEYYPDMASELWSLDGMDDREYQRKHEKQLDAYASALKDVINEGRTMVFNDYSRFGPE